jgi:2-polyprenyl-3-methyl-5-hydroxy-6-metoxy-1,4-benzoquinol methylase
MHGVAPYPAMLDERAARAAAYESVRPEIVGLVPDLVRRVLDLGCSTGWLAQALKERGPVEVVGIERDPEYAAEARTRCDQVVEGDAEAVETRALGRFDCLVAADVLEHLVDPWSALERYAAQLDPGCRAIVSLPNVAHWTTYAQLARGRWPRRPEGVHDATHLRWFTRRDAIGLLEGAGLRVEHVEHRPWVLHRGTRLDRHAGPLARLAPFTFQHVLVARRA